MMTIREKSGANITTKNNFVKKNHNKKNFFALIGILDFEFHKIGRDVRKNNKNKSNYGAEKPSLGAKQGGAAYENK